MAVPVALQHSAAHGRLPASAQTSWVKRVSKPPTRAILGLMSLNFLGVMKNLRIAALMALGVSGAALADSAVPPGPSGSYPARAEDVQRWIDRLDDRRIRAHAWDVWHSITRPVAAERGEPIWQTWYSGHELFGVGVAARTQRHGVLPFETGRQVHHPHGAAIPRTPAEQPTSFNRFSPAVAHVIWDRRLNDAAELDRINADFDRRGTPVRDRQIQTSLGPVDARSIVLKPVFQFIDGGSPTAIAVWTGVSPAATTNLANPTADTWRRCVVVDPTGTLRPGSHVSLPCNAEPAQPWPVVGLDQFYAIRLTEAQARDFSAFAEGSGDDVGAGNKTDVASLKARVKAGNVALLVAMHVTTKEIANWTWQTFWWGADPGDAIYGADRPKRIGRPWSRYNMTAAYYMTAPARDPAGEPWIAFNPYLETNLAGNVPGPGGRPIAWTGVHSNCMSCHRMAAWKAAAQPKPGRRGNSPAYQPSGLIDPADAALFDGYTKLDFLWSLTRAAPRAR